MKPVLQCAVMLVLVLLAGPGDAGERLVPYDDFNATHLNPDRWFGGEFGTAFPRWSTEAIRQIQDHTDETVHIRIEGSRIYQAVAA